MKKLAFFLLNLLIYTAAFSQVDTSFYNLSLIDLSRIKISTPGRNITTILTAPSNIITITAQQIKQNNYTCLRDLLDDIPQIIIQHQSSDEDNDIYTINGISGNEKFLILMDGVRINSAAGTDITIAESYSLANVKQVEIILNPSSALYGSDAFTAIVNIITYKPGEMTGLNANIYRGNFNTTSSTISANYKIKNIGISLTGKYYYSDEPFMPNYYLDIYHWYYTYQRTGKVIHFGDTISSPIGIKPWDMHTKAANLRAKIFYKNWELGYMSFYESHSSSLAGRPEYSIYCKQAHYNTNLSNFYLKNTHKNRRNNIQTNSLLNFQVFKILPTSAFVNRYTDFNIAYKYENAKNIHWEENFQFSGIKKSLINFGTTVDMYDIIPKTGDLPIPYDESKPYNLQNIYYFGTNVQDTSGRNLTIYQDFYRIKYYNLSTYAQITNNFNHKLYIIAGIRYGYNSRYGHVFLPRVSIVFTPSSYWSIKFIYGKSFLAPSAHIEYQHFGSFLSVRDSLGRIIGLTSPFWHLTSPNLRPQYKSSYELSFTNFINDNLFIKINAFYSPLYNLIERYTVSDTTFHGIHVDQAWIMKNTGFGKAYGATFSFADKFKISFLNAEFSLSYTYIDGYISNQPLQFSPRHSVKTKLNISYQDNINILFGGQYRSSSFLAPNLHSPSYFVMYATGNALVFEQKQLNLWFSYKIMNLLSTRYFNLADGSEGPSPQKIFAFLVGLKASF